MLTTLCDRSRQYNLTAALIALLVLALAFLLGQRASPLWLGLLVAGMGAALLLQEPRLGLLAIVAVALLLRMDISTGTEVFLSPVTLLAPAVLAIWLLDSVRRRQISFVSSRANLPLALFLLAGLLSLVLGIATWDAFVPRKGNFTLVQLAQWGIFALSAGAFWLTANLIKEEAWLRRLTWAFLLIGGGVAILRAIPGVGGFVSGLTSIAFIRAPFWVLLAGLAGGQLLFNRDLRRGPRAFLLLVLGATLVYAFVEQQEAASNWVGIAAVFAVLIWLRFPRLRWPLLALVVAAALAGVLFPAVYDFAGGDQEWTTSGESRLVLTRRVLDVTMRNPILGLGPAAYRPYASTQPLVLENGRLWVGAVVSSHNNYVDIFSHTGLLGLALLAWFVAEIALLFRRLHARYSTGFAAGYVNAVAAAGVGSLVIMLLADWILPFVYNIGFGGFQASILVWLFLGGLVALENVPQPVTSDQ